MALLPSVATAQVWQDGGGGSPANQNYNNAANWTTNTVADAAGEPATFADAGTNVVTVTAGSPISPQSWTFDPNSQNYLISGQAVNFVTGLTNNVNAGWNINISNDMTGTTLNQTGGSTLVLNGVVSFTNTSVTGGILSNNSHFTSTVSISAGGTYGNNGTLTGSISNSGTFSNNLNATMSGLVTNNAGTTINRGELNGGVVVAGGTFTQIVSGAVASGLTNAATVNAAGAINGAIANNGTATFTVTGGNLTGNNTYTNSGTAVLSVSGGDLTGVTTLTNNSTNATGIAVAAGRTLAATSLVNAAGATISNLGAITTASTVNDGTITGAYGMAAGTLSGTGNTHYLSVSGGTFAPGNGAPGSAMTVTSSLAMQSGAVYMVQINPTTSSFANVTGTATLGGAIVNAVYANGNFIAKQYTILTAGTRSGTFNSLVNTNLPSNFSSSLSYDANNAFLNLTLNFAVPSGLNGNQQNVANALTGFFDRTGGIPLVFGALSPVGLTQISGEAATGTQQTTFDAMSQFMGVMTDPFVAGRGEGVSPAGGMASFAESAYASSGKPRSKNERDAYAAIYRKAPVMADPFTQRWSVWGAGYGGSQTTDGNATVGSSNVSSRIYGVAAGADYRFSPYTLAGFALAGGGTNFSIANGLGSSRSDLFQAGAWLRHNVGAAYLTAALAYGWQDITTDRTVTVAGIDQLRAKFDANAWSGRLESGYRFVAQGVGLTPYAAGQFATFQLPKYAEAAVSGANTFALSYAAKDVKASRSELGVRTDKSFAVQDGVFTLRGRAAWAHNFNTDRNVLSTFQTLPGASFVVNGAAQLADAALATTSAEMKWLNGFSVAGTFEGEFSNVVTSYAGKGVIRYAW